jgi:hypothetical protein
MDMLRAGMGEDDNDPVIGAFVKPSFVSPHDLCIPEDMEAVSEVAGRYGLEFTGPPLAAIG